MDPVEKPLVERLSIEGAGAACDYLSDWFLRTPLVLAYHRDEEMTATREQGIVGALWDQLEYINCLYLKMDSVQQVYTFKARGAANWFQQRKETGTMPASVVTASAGNHAQGVGLAASTHGVPATIFMPENAPLVKVRGVEKYEGVTVVLEGGTYDEAGLAAKEHAQKEGAAYLHAFQDPDVIYGQATSFYEVRQKILGLRQVGRREAESIDPGKEQEMLMAHSPPDVVISPIGGGGLITGIGLIADHYDRQSGGKTHVIGVQTEASDSMARSFEAGRLMGPSGDGVTCADGINVRQASEEMLGCVLEYVNQVVTVPETATLDAIRTTYGDWRLNLQKELARKQQTSGGVVKHAERIDALDIAEGAAAVSLASLLSKRVDLPYLANQFGRPVNLLLMFTGSNIDRDRHEAILQAT